MVSHEEFVRNIEQVNFNMAAIDRSEKGAERTRLAQENIGKLAASKTRARQLHPTDE